MQFLRTNTATRITVGPFLDKTDGVTPETGITVTSCKLTLVVDDGGVPTLVLDANPTASGGANDMVHITGDDAGYYDLELAASNVNYLGRARLAITDAAVHCPVFCEFMILPAMIYDSLVLGTDVLQTDVTQLLGTAWLTPGVAGTPDVNTKTITAGAITAAAIATGAIDADALATDAVTEIWTGVTDSSGVTTLLSRLTALRAGYLDNLSGGAVALATALVTLQTSVDDLPTNAELATALGTADDAVLAAIGALNNLSQAQIRSAIGLASANLDTQLDALPTNAELATALAAADDAVLAAIAALNNLSSAQAQTAATAALNAYDPPTKVELDSAVAPLATTVNVSAVETKVDTVLSRIGAFTGSGLNTILGFFRAIGRKTAALTPSDMGGTYDNTTDSLEAQADATGGSAPTVEEIADGVLDALAADHDIPDTIGAKINDAGAAGDPLANQVPGTYTPGQAGYVIGHNLDAQISALIAGYTPTPVVRDTCGNVRVFDAGEKDDVKVSLTAEGGTVTISAVKVYLQTATGAAVGTLTNVNATGFDVGGLVTAEAWFTLDTAEPNTGDDPLEVGTYELLFVIFATKSDTHAIIREIPVTIQVV